MTAGRPSYNCRLKNCEQWRSLPGIDYSEAKSVRQTGKNFCLTKPDSALLSGEELNSCSHCEQFLGNYTAAGDFSLPSFLLVVSKESEMILSSAKCSSQSNSKQFVLDRCVMQSVSRIKTSCIFILKLIQYFVVKIMHMVELVNKSIS